MRKKTLSILILCWITINIQCQKEANIWYFGNWAGIDFNSGEPVPIDGFFGSFLKSGIMCDSTGVLIMACDGKIIYNGNKEVMQNGQLLELYESSESALIVKKPGENSLYYVFVTHYWDDNSPDYEMYYSIVDMKLENGLGSVIEKDVLLVDAWDATEKIISVKHENNKDIWIVTRNRSEGRYTSFLLTESGLNTNGVFSPAIPRDNGYFDGDIDISPDKKRLVAAYTGGGILVHRPEFEICNFSSETGHVELLYTIKLFALEGDPYSPEGVAFSPDSKYLYLSLDKSANDYIINQYDLNYYEDSVQFVNSAIEICTAPAQGMQLARDGKIYCTNHAADNQDKYLSVIHKPWERGEDCNCEENALVLVGGTPTMYLPNIMLDYLYRFEWEGRCSAEPFVFQPNFQPEPVSIQWNFSDPGAGSDSISGELNPIHYFTYAGDFEVNVVVQYPNGRVERTSRVVTVDQSPQPNLGPDTLMCAFGEITLDAGEEEGFYLWSNGSFGQNSNELTISDTGWYWVDVTNEVDCTVRDSIYIGLYPQAEIDESALQIIPTACGGSTGKILGLQVWGTEPLTFEWYDADSNFLSNELDLENLPVGNYYLYITDGNGCATISEAYTIFDSGDIEVTEVDKEVTHCNQSDGSITISVNIGNTEDLLYSINNGNTWQTGNPVFTNLSSGNYFVRVKDESGCEGVYENNPVAIEDVAGPQVTNVTAVPEIDYLQNGQIGIAASIAEGQIHYSIDDGTTFQTDDGLFTNLSAGTYYCLVKDDFGCDTTFTMEVTRTISQLIEAIAGDDNTCLGDAAVVPLVFNNFTGVSKFHVYLTYDTSILHCDGYINSHEDIEAELQVSLLPNTGEVIISWEGVEPITLPDNARLTELVLGAKGEGISPVDWIAMGGESFFYNENGDEISVDYQLGKVRVFSRPQINMAAVSSPCEGDDFSKYPWAEGGAGEFTYLWEGPNGFQQHQEVLHIANIQQQNAGQYLLTVTDTLNCLETKELELIVDENPKIAFAAYDTIFGEPGFVLQAGGDYNYYMWNTGERTQSITINTEGIYSVEIGTTGMCFAKDSVTILWGGEPFYMPNAFSPNSDGLNDEFKPVQRYDYVSSYNLSIYNRWGELIFATSDIEQGWDGSYKGNQALQGTYVYRIVYTAHTTGGETQVKTGQVTLVR